METVALEWSSSREVESDDVILFMQQLNHVPSNAFCEIDGISSQRRGVYRQNQDKEQIRSVIHLKCDSKVAEFLCKKFGKQTRHVARGEVIQVRCIRVSSCLMSWLSKPCAESDENTEATTELQMESHVKDAVLPIAKVIGFLDLLGDQVVEALEAYELYADKDAKGPRRMTMLGLTKALSRLSKNAKQSLDFEKGNNDVKIFIESLRQLLSRLITSNNIAVKNIPVAPTIPFLSYTDFLATYVAFLPTIHLSTSGRSISHNFNLKKNR